MRELDEELKRSYEVWGRDPATLTDLDDDWTLPPPPVDEWVRSPDAILRDQLAAVLEAGRDRPPSPPGPLTRLNERFRPVAKAPFYHFRFRDIFDEHYWGRKFERMLRSPAVRRRAAGIVARMDLPRLCGEKACHRANRCGHAFACVFELRDLFGGGEGKPLIDLAELPAERVAELRIRVQKRAEGPAPFTATVWNADGLPLRYPTEPIDPLLREKLEAEGKLGGKPSGPLLPGGEGAAGGGG